MEFKGTKGDWYVVGSQPAEIATYKTSICFLGIQDYFKLDAEQRANAKLIAAAPELLKAAIKALNDCCDLIGTEAGNSLEEAINKALN